MKIVLLLAFLLNCVGNGNDTVEKLYVDGVWEHMNGTWQTPPPELELDQRSAAMTLIRFESSGLFWSVTATVIDQSGTYTISDGDPLHVSKGVWRSEGEDIRVEYQTVYRALPVRPDDRHVAKSGRVLVANAAESMLFDGKRFIRSPLKAGELERVIRLAVRAAGGETK